MKILFEMGTNTINEWVITLKSQQIHLPCHSVVFKKTQQNLNISKINKNSQNKSIQINLCFSHYKHHNRHKPTKAFLWKGFLEIRRLLSLDAKFSVICRNSAHGCCTYSFKTYRLTVFNVFLIFSYVRCQFCFKGQCRLEILIINCMCYFQYYTCVKHR